MDPSWSVISTLWVILWTIVFGSILRQMRLLQIRIGHQKPKKSAGAILWFVALVTAVIPIIPIIGVFTSSLLTEKEPRAES